MGIALTQPLGHRLVADFFYQALHIDAGVGHIAGLRSQVQDPVEIADETGGAGIQYGFFTRPFLA